MIDFHSFPIPTKGGYPETNQLYAVRPFHSTGSTPNSLLSRSLRTGSGEKRVELPRYTRLRTCHNFQFDSLEIQLNPAPTDFKGPINFIYYRRNSVIANIGNKRKQVERTEI